MQRENEPQNQEKMTVEQELELLKEGLSGTYSKLSVEEITRRKGMYEEAIKLRENDPAQVEKDVADVGQTMYEISSGMWRFLVEEADRELEKRKEQAEK